MCFRYAPPGWAGDAARLDALNKLLVERIQARGSGLPHRHGAAGAGIALRACVLHYGTTEADVDALVEIVRETGARLSPA